MPVRNESRSVAVIVAHPDDETLWAGGTILSRPSWRWFILSMCRGSDPDRAPRFFNALKSLGADGKMCDLDDEPEQNPLVRKEIERAILQTLPLHQFDLIISHNPAGEYTRHRRHEEVGEAVITLWHSGEVRAGELWTFAYQDGCKLHLPQPMRSAHRYDVLSGEIWKQKYDIITKTYGFKENGFEAATTPRAEAFWRFTDPATAREWLTKDVFHYESSITL